MTDIFYIYLKSEVSILFQLGSVVDIVDAQMHSIKMKIRVAHARCANDDRFTENVE